MSDVTVPAEVQQIILDELEQCREKILERIASTRKLTDSEVYQAGAALNDVVNTAKEYMSGVSDRMSNSASANDTVQSILNRIHGKVEEQQGMVTAALDNLSGISNAGQKIKETSGASRLLALNARVESARFGGEGGRAFNVIADEMRELAQSVETTNTMVSKLAGKLQKSLPEIQQQTDSIRGSIDELVSEMAQRSDALAAVFQASVDEGSAALDSILSSARDGLSHLQFQDLMIQDLEGIERVLRKSFASVAGAMGADTTSSDDTTFLGTLGADLDEEEGANPDLEHGEVLLF